MRTTPRPPAAMGEIEPEAGTSEEVGPSGEMETLVKDLRSDLGGIHDSLKRTLHVEWQRFRLRTLDACFRAAFLVCLFGFALAASVSGAVLVAAGLREAVTLWSGAAWLGDLGAGSAILGFAIGLLWVVRARLRRNCVLEAKRAGKSPNGNDGS